MVCDFFCQPGLPVALDFQAWFTGEAVRLFAEPELTRWRIAHLMPIFRLKWCGIVLNDFLPVDSRRRQFALNSACQDERKKIQFDKARAMLAQV